MENKKKDNGALLMGAFTALVITSMLVSLALLYKDDKKDDKK